MIVEEIMKTDISVLTPNDSFKTAIAVMSEKKIRHIPIINENQVLVGLVTERDLKEVTSTILYDVNQKEKKLNILIKEFMKSNIITGHPLDFVAEVAALFYEHRIGCLPILKDQKLIGMITSTDLLHTMVQLTGANQPGSQIEVKVPNRTGILYEIAGILHQHKVNIHSVLVYPDKKDESSKIIVFRISTMNPVNVIDSLKKGGHIVLWPNLPGVQS